MTLGLQAHTGYTHLGYHATCCTGRLGVLGLNEALGQSLNLGLLLLEYRASHRALGLLLWRTPHHLARPSSVGLWDCRAGVGLLGVLRM